MGLRRLEVTSFRTFEKTVFLPDTQGTTVLIGPNGTGKTSLIEAVGYLGLGRSLRGSPKEAMVRNGATTAILRAELVIDDREILIEAEIAREGRGRTQINRQSVKSRKELAEIVAITTFCPDDLAVIQGGPGSRREVLDDALALLNPESAGVIDDVDKILRQRNALLRQSGGRASDDVISTLEVWDSRLVESGDRLIEIRQALLARLAEPINDAYQTLAGDDTERIDVHYASSAPEGMAQGLRVARTDDLRRGVTTVGPHRDDIELLLGGRDTRTQASQGEQRTLALALRLAVHVAAKEQRGEAPLLLLDDVFSELDPERSRRLINELPEGQAFITTASPLPDGINPAIVLDVRELL